MRVKGFPTRCFSGAFCALVLAVSAVSYAQEERPLPAIEEEEPLNDIKLLAQSAAIPALSGAKPFILRESWWKGNLKPGAAKLIQIQLFRRNEYQFWMAAPDVAAGLNLNVYNSEGDMVEAETVTYPQTNVVSTIVKPESTGLYYVRVSLKTTIDESQDWAVIYAYR